MLHSVTKPQRISPLFTVWESTAPLRPYCHWSLCYFFSVTSSQQKKERKKVNSAVTQFLLWERNDIMFWSFLFVFMGKCVVFVSRNLIQYHWGNAPDITVLKPVWEWRHIVYILRLYDRADWCFNTVQKHHRDIVSSYGQHDLFKTSNWLFVYF